jgi:hypothetical protein
MSSTLKLATRNLLRYQRRTLLTALLIMLGVVALLLFVAAAGSFKQTMVGSITDSMLGHLQVHRKGYTASMDNLPLTMSLQPKAVEKLDRRCAQGRPGRGGVFQARQARCHVQQLYREQQHPPERRGRCRRRRRRARLAPAHQ